MNIPDSYLDRWHDQQKQYMKKIGAKPIREDHDDDLPDDLAEFMDQL